MPVLGCGSYQVFLTPRGDSSTLVAQVPWDSLTWERVLDDTSQAQPQLSLADPACCDLLSVARPWRHEIVIFRDDVPVWLGPLFTVVEPPEQNTLSARDITAWWDRRFVHDDHTYPVGTDVSTIFQAINDDAMRPDPSPNLQLQIAPTGVGTSLQTLAAQHLIAGDQLRDLARLGVDYTAFLRQVIAGAPSVPVPAIGPFTDEHFATPPTPTRDGSMQANTVVVRGAGGGSAGDSIYGSATDLAAAAADGLLEAAVSITTVRDNAAAQSAAMTRVELTREVVVVDTCVLAAGAPVDINQLIPGALVDLRSTLCVPVNQIVRLSKVSVTADASDNRETVTLTLQPVGTID